MSFGCAVVLLFCQEYRLQEVKGKRKVDLKVWTKGERERWRLRAVEEQASE